MAFPQYTKGVLGMFKKPVEWEDVGPWLESGPNETTQTFHKACQTRCHEGREMGMPFRFCPECLEKTFPDTSFNVTEPSLKKR